MEKFGKYEVIFDKEDGCWYQIGVAWEDLVEGDLVLIDWEISGAWERLTTGIRCLGRFDPTAHYATADFHFKFVPNPRIEEKWHNQPIPPLQDFKTQKFKRQVFFGILKNWEIENFRGFISKQQISFAPFGFVTFLIGPNNSGKSLVARSFDICEARSHKDNINSLSIYDFPNHDGDYHIHLGLCLNTHLISLKQKDNSHVRLLAEANLKYKILRESAEIKGIRYLEIGGIKSVDESDENGTIEFSHSTTFIERFKILGAEGLGTVSAHLSRVVQDGVLLLSPIRSLDQRPLHQSQETGKKIVNWLNDERAISEVLKVRDHINQLLIQLNIPPTESLDYDPKSNQLFFKYDGRKFLLSELGTGISMIMILLLEIYLNPKLNVIFIDEIECHLQPGLVRSLIQILRNFEYKGKRRHLQLVISTHSPFVLDCAIPGDEIYRFEKVGKECRVHPFINGREDLIAMRKAANSLGGLPGDALLSNVVIWVEGPTDVKWIRALLAAYLNYKRKDDNPFPYLIDGLHYSIIMTGGALIAHYQFFEDNGLESGISVTRVNPNPFVIIDGDGLADRKVDKKFDRANTFANQLRKQNEAYESQRVKDFLGEGTEEPDDRLTHGKVNNFWWLKGKEIENYCPPALMKEFIESMAGELDKKWQIEVFSTKAGEGFDWIKGNVEEKLKQIEKKVKDFKKIDLANFVSERLTKDHLKDKSFQDSQAGKDLMDGLERLVGFVLAVNEIEG